VYSALPGLQDGSLVRVLPGHTLYPLEVYALYPSRQYLDAKIRTWVEFLRERLPARLAADERQLRACSAPPAVASTQSFTAPD
jgi:DNA-binding transcriptional LysR family regulator